MKSLKLSITLIALFTTSICLGQANSKKENSEPVILENPIHVSQHKAQSSEQLEKNITPDNQMNDVSNKIDESYFPAQQIEDERIMIEENLYPAHYLNQLVDAYESGVSGIDAKVKKLIDEKKLTTSWLSKNNVGINTKLYKKVDEQKLSK